MNGLKKLKDQFEVIQNDASGKVAAPILMYILGVPAFLCVLAWLFFFKNK